MHNFQNICAFDANYYRDQLNDFPAHFKRMRGLGDGVRFNAIAEATHAVAA
jgi:hypothetical protein